MPSPTNPRYTATWGTGIGQDCITLKVPLAKWLGPRLLFLAEHTRRGTAELREFADRMAVHGHALAVYGESGDHEAEATVAMRWVADRFSSLWH